MKISMIPDNSVKVVHASQGDVGRRWEFEPYDNEGLIDLSSVGEQIVYPVYHGGTEQILPENTSVPSTAPILADIQYPDELRENQQFTYREVPSVEDGQAKIKKIYGQGLVWNQLVQNGNFVNTSNWSAGGGRGTLSATNNELSYIITTIGTAIYLNRIQQVGLSLSNGHKIIIMFDFYALRNGSMQGICTDGSVNVTGDTVNCVSGWNRYRSIITLSRDCTGVQGCFSAQNGYSVGETVKWRNFVLIDLTAMGLDTLTAQQFEALFPLPYYSFNQGKLLPFVGESIKTTGKNRLPLNLADIKTINTSGTWNNNVYTLNGVTYTVNVDDNGWLLSILLGGTSNGSSNLLLINRRVGEDFYNNSLGKSLIITGCPSGGTANSFSLYGHRVRSGSSLNIRDTGSGDTFVFNPSDTTWNFAVAVSSGTNVSGKVFYPMIRYADVQDSTFEPYHEEITPLPILDYFPDGMKKAGNVFDELSENRVVKRVRSVDLGALNYSYDPPGLRFLTDDVTGALVSNYNLSAPGYLGSSDIWIADGPDKVMGIDSRGRLFIRNLAYTDPATFKSALSGVMLFYELAEYEEQDFTIASLVTQNEEIPLVKEDNSFIAYSTQEVTENPGFHDCKIKLEGDGVAYSSKIRLHVERKP